MTDFVSWVDHSRWAVAAHKAWLRTCPPCPVCGDPILSDDPDLTHTPGTERLHAACCPDCNGEPE